VARVKPFPDVYQAVLTDLRLFPEEVISFEDSPNGIQSAKAAGLYCVAVPNPITRLLNFSQADWVLPSLSDLRLRDLLKRVDPSG
jgi:beta-phosphoglucomutase-like phosphatase (HAD superfamily)